MKPPDVTRDQRSLQIIEGQLSFHANEIKRLEKLRAAILDRLTDPRPGVKRAA